MRVCGSGAKVALFQVCVSEAISGENIKSTSSKYEGNLITEVDRASSKQHINYVNIRV